MFWVVKQWARLSSAPLAALRGVSGHEVNSAPSRAQGMKLGELVDRYLDAAKERKKTWKQDRSRLRSLILPQFGDREVPSITSDELLWTGARMADGDHKLSELITVRFTAHQGRDIQNRARWHRLSKSEVIRQAALAVELKMPAAQIEERRFLEALHGLGLQLNTLARFVNTFGRVYGIRSELLALLERLGAEQAEEAVELYDASAGLYRCFGDETWFPIQRK